MSVMPRAGIGSSDRLSMILAMLALAGPLSAAEFCVSDADGLQEALTEAATNSEPDVIRLQSGEYLGTFVFASQAEQYGVSLLGGFDAGCVVRSGNRGGTILDGGGAGVVLAFSVPFLVPADFVIEQVTIRNGYRAQEDGGGVYIATSGNIVVSDTHFEGNHASGDGGAMYVHMGANGLTLQGNVFSSNSSGAWGGAVRVFSARDLRISDNLFHGNQSYLSGGALHIWQSPLSTSDVVSNNSFIYNSIQTACSACRGGAIEANLGNETASFYLENNAFFGNVAVNNADFWLGNDPDDDFIVSPLIVRGNAWDHDGNGTGWQRHPSVASPNVDASVFRFVDEPEQDFRPGTKSPLVDRGVAGLLPPGDSDLSGRPRVQGAGIDIGAYESSPKPRMIAIRGATPLLAVMDFTNGSETIRARTLDPGTGVVYESINFDPGSARDVASVSASSLGGSAGIGLLAMTEDGRPRVQLRDYVSGTWVRNQNFFDPAWSPLGMQVMPTLHFDGAEDMAVLAENLSTGEIAVQVRDSATGSFVTNSFFLNSNWQAEELLVLDAFDANPGPELGVLATNGAGQIVVMVKDAASNSFIRNVFFLNANWRPIQALVLQDFSGNGVNELALLAQNRDSGQLVVMVKDAATNMFLNNVFPFGAGWDPIRVVALPDENANGASELAVLGVQKESGKPVIQVRDSMTGDFLRNLPLLGSAWDVSDMRALQNVGGVQRGLAVLAFRKLDGVPVVQTIDAETGGLVSNVFLNAAAIDVSTLPIASAGRDQTVVNGTTFLTDGTPFWLDGTGSRDSDGGSSTLSYSWSFVTKPAGSLAALSDPSSPTPSFAPDVPGTYELQLVVNNGATNSLPDVVAIASRAPSAILESEYNDEREFATGFEIFDTATGSLANQNDVDWYTVTVNSEQIVSVTFDATSSSQGMWNVYWYDRDMSVLSGRNIEAAAEPFEYTFPAFKPGPYYLRIQQSLSFIDSGGPYSVTVGLVP